MPELPEVESTRRSLARAIQGRRVRAVEVFRRDVVVAPGDPEGGFSRQRKAAKPVPLTDDMLLRSARFVEPARRGKQLALVANDGRAIVVHLGMTGAVLVRTKDVQARSPHEHVRWLLDDGSVMVFDDARRFGGLWVVPSADALRARWETLGPDALGITADALRHELARRRTPIKAALLDQRVLAGVGNIYADESLFRAGIRPDREARGLSRPRIERLAQAIRDVLHNAVRAGGSTLRDFRDADGRPGSYRASHAVYGRGGEQCPSCGARLRTGSCAQRTTVWCGRCQR
ncbi:MAG: bifunctional DNA-formamidopyrimidine glycosylase/DNA-(apurinic or apyrimidinic site) lyase [Planctomycetota bacterium]